MSKFVVSEVEINIDCAGQKVTPCDNPQDWSYTIHRWIVPQSIHMRFLCTADIPVIRKHLFLDGSISAVLLRWTLLKAFRANKRPVHSAGPSSFSAFHLYLGTHCWHLQVWCLCYHSRNDLVRWKLRLVDFAYFNPYQYISISYIWFR